MPTRSIRLGLLAALAAVSAPSWAQDTRPSAEPESKPQAKSKAASKATRPRRDPPGTYMGRPIAPVMSYLGAEWLIRETRVDEEQPDRMLDALKLKPGDVVADVGAGVGYTSERIARRVGQDGKVLATDVQPQMLEMLAERMKAAGVKNVEPKLCTQDDTKLPEGSVDLAILVDVYHEASRPDLLLQGIFKALKPGGRLVLVEFRGEDPEVPIRPEHKMTLDQVKKEVAPQGFAFVESQEFLPWQHLIIFRKPATVAGAEGKTEP
ncbi:MAG: methyltransferase domain-containing protein [Isosphaeraceae bacterium]